MENKELAKAVEILKSGGLVVMPTDTIYGVHCVALEKGAIERVYRVRERDQGKPCIILISQTEQIELFGIGVFKRTKKFFQRIWPGKVSIIIPISRSQQEKFKFLHRGVGSLGFRMPELGWLRKVIDQTGPLLSTSANLQGMSPAKNVNEARDYFGAKVDLYLDGGELDSVPSSLAEIENGKLKVLRRGEIDLDKVDF